MKKRIAILLTLAMLLGMVGFAEDIEVEDEIVINVEEVEFPPGEVEPELGDIDLSIDDAELSAENELDENDWGHSAIVWKREGDTLTLIECNFDAKCGISWGRRTVNVYATGNNYIVGFWHADNWNEVNG